MNRRQPINSAVVAGYLPFTESIIGFQLLLFYNKNGEIVIQQAGTLNKISSFRQIDVDKMSVAPLPGNIIAREGDELVYAFSNEYGSISVGNINEIKSSLISFAQRRPTEKAIILQIFELCGSKYERKNCRVAVREQILQKSGLDEARKFYEGSVLKDITWNAIMSFFSDQDARRRVAKARPRLVGSLTSEGEIVFNLDALAQGDLARIDLGELDRLVREEFETHPISPSNPTSWQAEFDVSAPEAQAVAAILERVRASSRQERRIAIILQALVDNRSTGILTLNIYRKDIGKFANSALQDLRGIFVKPKMHLGPQSSDVHLVAKCIRSMYNDHHPMSRGSLLYAFAKELGNNNVINSTIRDLAAKTHSVIFDNFRDDIEAALQEHATNDGSKLHGQEDG